VAPKLRVKRRRANPGDLRRIHSSARQPELRYTGPHLFAHMRMASELQIRQATAEDAQRVSDILREAAQWLEQEGKSLWKEEHIGVASIAEDVRAGLFFLAEYSGEPAATLRFQLEDALFWPDAGANEAAYVHRLAVRRQYAGTGLSTQMLRWAAERTRNLGRPYLRLDCVASRPRLRAVYERFGFRHHSDRQVGNRLYLVARYQYDVAAPKQ
jgi:GNAT superfamily N-acetyltransferase